MLPFSAWLSALHFCANITEQEDWILVDHRASSALALTVGLLIERLASSPLQAHLFGRRAGSAAMLAVASPFAYSVDANVELVEGSVLTVAA